MIVGTILVVSGHMDTHGVICSICICACTYVVVRLCVIVLLLLLLVPNDLTTLATRMATAPPMNTFNSQTDDSTGVHGANSSNCGSH